MSLRKVADAGTVTSHHCHLLLHALAARTAHAGLTEARGHLSAAADAPPQAPGLRWGPSQDLAAFRPQEDAHPEKAPRERPPAVLAEPQVQPPLILAEDPPQGELG